MKHNLKIPLCLTCFSQMFPHSLRSTDELLVVLKSTRRLRGDRSFSVAASKLWIGLTLHIRQTESLLVFKSFLKAYFFPHWLLTQHEVLVFTVIVIVLFVIISDCGWNKSIRCSCSLAGKVLLLSISVIGSLTQTSLSDFSSVSWKYWLKLVLSLDICFKFDHLSQLLWCIFVLWPLCVFSLSLSLSLSFNWKVSFFSWSALITTLLSFPHVSFCLCLFCVLFF